MRVWYVDESRTPVDLGTIRDGDGLATATVRRIVEQPDGSLLTFAWARAGRPLWQGRLDQATREVSGDAVPAEPVPSATEKSAVVTSGTVDRVEVVSTLPAASPDNAGTLFVVVP